MTTPDVSASTLEAVVQAALEEYFLYSVPEEKFVRYEKDAYDALEVQNFLFEAGAYEALEKHILKEIEKPTLKGPGLKWKLRRLFDKL